MKINDINTYLTYAHLQMAAEAFIGNTRITREDYDNSHDEKIREKIYENTGKIVNEDLLKTQNFTNQLTDGNHHASKFTKPTAAEFIQNWKVVQHISNTTTGFSGTLFQAEKDIPGTNIKQGDQVLSFRSTEFVDDAARDSISTNVLEIADKGFAFGQIADMRAWVHAMQDAGVIKNSVSVTGYSLGAHLATAFYQLQSEGDFMRGNHSLAIKETYTFNGAGIGKLLNGTALKDVINTFQEIRSGEKEYAFKTSVGEGTYQKLKAISDNKDIDIGRKVSLMKSELTTFAQNFISPAPAEKYFEKLEDFNILKAAVDRVSLIWSERDRHENFAKAPKGEKLVPVDWNLISGLDIKHQVGAVVASQNTKAHGKVFGAGSGLEGIGTNQKTIELKNNFYDIIGDTFPSMVAVSQTHFGKDIRVSIEDQPLSRGSYSSNVAAGTLGEIISNGQFDVKLLVDEYGINAFGDTHSLVLIVDSLATQQLFSHLDHDFEIEKFKPIKALASNIRAKSGSANKDQGVAEGDVLENLVNHLAKTLGISEIAELEGDIRGGTWHEPSDKDSYHGREKLHATIQKLLEQTAALADAFEISPNTEITTDSIRSNFSHFLAITQLSPFVLKEKNGNASNFWQEKHSELYRQWTYDKQAIEQGKLPVYYSNEWIADRMEILSIKNIVDNNNLDSYTFKTIHENTFIHNQIPTDEEYIYAYFGNRNENSRFRFDDHEMDIRIAKTHADLSANKLERSIQFGASEKPNDLQGGEGVDHLYGGDKNDTLAGLAGRDHLEGGGGIDTYIIKDQDTIFDNDGKGKLVFEDGDAAHFVADGSANASASGSEATTHARPADEGKESVRWVSVNDAGEADGRFVAERIGDDLLVRSTKNGNDRAMVKNYFLVAKEKDSGWSGVLGLHLGRSIPEEEEPEAEYNLMIGDQVAPFQSDGKTYDWSATRWNYQTGELEGSVAKKDFPDVLRGTTGKDLIRGLGGNDALYGSAGEDILYGNGGHDLLVGGTGSDKLYGEAGDDVMLGASTLMDYVRWRDVYSKGGLPKGMTYTYQNGGVWGLYQDPRKTIKTIAGALIDEIKDDSNTRGDLLIGGEGRDMIFGSHEHDRIYGGMAPDMEDTDTGADAIWGLGGDDEIYGGAGDDVIRGDGKDDPTLFGYTPRAFHGNDRIYAGAGNDTVFAYGGDDFVDAGDGHDYVYGHTGNDYIVGGAGNDFLIGDDNIDSLKPGLESGDDIIFGNEGEDRILGGKGNDLLYGNEGNDIIFGSEGDDELQGGDGDDILSGDNVHGPNEHGEMSGNDILHGGGGDDSLYGGKGDDHLLGDGGTDALYGNEGNDILRGGDGIDGLYGNEGDDILYGDAGNDQLTGGTGSDQLHGGAGADRYFFTAVDMQDGEKDIIHDDGLGENGMPDLIMLDGAAATGFEWTFDADQKRWDSSTGWTLERKNGSTLNLHHESSSGVIQLTDYQEGDYGLVLPDFNTPVTPEDPNPEDPQNPQPPSSGAPLAAQSIDEKQALSFTVPESAFQSGKDDPLSYSAQLADGKPLPAWLTFDSSTRTFSGTPGNDDVGTLNIELSAKGKGGSASQRFTLNILNVNDAPQAGEALADVQAERGKPLTYVLPANAFTDIDKDDTLTLSATLDNGDALPAWLNFDAAQARFTGTPPVDAQTAYRIVLTATDKAGESVSQNFALTIHSAPQVGTENHDKIWGKATNDRIDGGAGNDKIYGGEGDDEINGGADNDALWGNAGNDILRGGEGDDYLSGEDGDDILEGGAGNDLLSAGKGNDIYRFSGDFGRDTVRNLQGKDDGGGHDALEFTDLRLEDIIFEKNNFSGLIIKNRKNSALVSVDNYFLNDGKSPYHIDEIRLADGHTLDYATVKAKAYQSTDGDDLVWGDDGDNTLHGGLGDDTLHGGDGNDQLQGDSGNDKLFGYSGNDRLIGGQGNDYMLAGTGNNTLLGGEGNDNLRSNAGNDILAGGTGHDSLNGGAGDDLYIYRQGDGRDFIIDQGGSDILFLPDFDQNQFSQHLVRQGQNLELRLDAANSLTLHNFFAGDHAIEHIAFSDGSHLSVAEIHQQFGEKYQGSPAPYDHNRVLDEFSKISSIL